MIFAYLKIKEKISHFAAYHRKNLRKKRMANKNPNGNIIVNANGNYNLYDGGAHRDIFHKIKDEYVVGDAARSRMLSESEIVRLAPSFVKKLSSITGIKGQRVIDIISRAGRSFTADQVDQLLTWLNEDEGH